MGDLNVDFLPTLQVDPSRHDLGRQTRHCQERRTFCSWSKSLRMELFLPEHVLGSPGGQWAPFAQAPFTHVTTGEQIGLPSLLDYACLSEGCQARCYADWRLSPGDHAATVLKHKVCLAPRPVRHKRKWICRSWQDGYKWSSDCAPQRFRDEEHVRNFVRQLQDNCGDARSCSTRSRQREPSDIKELHTSIANSVTDIERRVFQTELRKRRQRWLQHLQEVRDANTFGRGGSISRSKKLSKLVSMTVVRKPWTNPSGQV